LKALAILDDFSHFSWKKDLLIIDCPTSNISEILEEHQPSFFFCESAWYGKDGSWFGKISNLSDELQEVISACKLFNLPTVFWCKEDPIHFDRFLLTASLFDFIFTTDINCISRYKYYLKHENIFLSPFASQPFNNNPLETFPRKRAFSYAGSYYRRFSERINDTKNILLACSSILSLDIYDRYHGSNDLNYRFPDEFKSFIKGSLPIDDVNLAYKGYYFGINLNSVKDSESMFARRVPELLGSGTITISNCSKAFPILFGGIINASDDPEIIVFRISEVLESDLLRSKLSLAGVRKVMLEHTYAKRLAKIASKVLGISEIETLPSVLVLMSPQTFSDATHTLSLLLLQSFSLWKCICILDDDILLNKLKVSNQDDRISFVKMSACLNDSISTFCKDLNWVSIFYCADYYGPNYLLDLVLATRYSNASAFGKNQFFKIVSGEIILQGSEGAYRPMTNMQLRSSLILVDHLLNLSVSQLFTDNAISSVEISDGMALDYLGYCREVFTQSTISVEQVSLIVDDLEINHGSSIDELYVKADNIKMAIPFWTGKPGLKFEKLANIFGDRFAHNINGSIDRFGWHIISELADGDTCDLFSEFAISIGDLGGKSGTPFYLEAGVGLQIQLLVRFEDTFGSLIDDAIFELNSQNHLIPPDSCTHIRLGYRITSSGSSRITRLVLG
jgi:hypothetical protein